MHITTLEEKSLQGMTPKPGTSFCSFLFIFDFLPHPLICVEGPDARTPPMYGWPQFPAAGGPNAVKHREPLFR
jgi:hypothetical protein